MKKEMLEPELKPKAKKKPAPKFMPSFKKSKPESVPSVKPNFMPPKPSFMPPKIMNNQHPRWQNFLELVNILFEYNDRRCSGDSKFARFVLSREGVDIEKSIEYLQDNGGYCDCEILMNVV